MCWLSLFIGYTTQEIKVNENQFSYNIQMSEDTQTLDEVVVVGFGTQRKANLTEAVATVDTKILDSRPVTNLGQSLQGTIPGLNLSVGGLGGQLGQTMDVNIRGTGTISTGSKAATLVLIDGIEGNMNNLNPDDVESISVLKDAAASSILWFTCGIRCYFDYYQKKVKQEKLASLIPEMPVMPVLTICRI